MQLPSILATKLYVPPLRPERVPRPRLIERLDAGLPPRDAHSPPQDAFPRTQGVFPRTRDAFPRALTLISAPAGFGKTTLVSEWVDCIRAGRGAATAPLRIAWLSLDEGDNDPARFLAYLIAALRTFASPTDLPSGVGGSEAHPGSIGRFGQGALSALQSPQPPPVEAILISLVNEIVAIPERIILVLDDYHLIENQTIHDALAFLFEYLPPQMHVVIATREDPHLPLPRLRARGQLTELRASDLRFTSSEAADFFNQAMGLGLSTEEIAALEERTEGWIAGLQLAAISMQGHKDVSDLIKTFAGSHRYVLDYLVEEVLEQQPENVQTFLLQTSVLDRLTGSLCDAVRSSPARSAEGPEQAAPVRAGALGLDLTQVPNGQESGQAILERLDRANLFIVPLDSERRWYRYHHLFAELLRQRLRQTARFEQVPTLHLRACAWYEQNGLTEEAIEHALRAEDFERAASLMEEHVDAIWLRGDHARVGRWLAGLPAELLFSKPYLCILHAWDLCTSGQQDAAEQCLQAAEQALERSSDLVPEISQSKRDPLHRPEKTKIQGRAATVRALLAFYRSDVPAMYNYSRLALEYLPEQDLTWRSAATVVLGDAYSFVGEMGAAHRVRLEAWEVSKAAGNFFMTLISGMKFAVTLRQQGQLQRVIDLCQQQFQLAEESGLSQMFVVGWLLAIWGEALAELNDLDGALHQAKKGIELAERGRDVAMIAWCSLCLTRVLFSSGEFAAAQEIVQRLEDLARASYVPPWSTSLVAAWQARLWLAQEKQGLAAQWVIERGLGAEGSRTYLHEVENMVLARILMAEGKLDEAGRLLGRLFVATEMGGRVSRSIEILLLQALVSQAQGDTGQAMTALQRALTLAEPRGFVRIFVDEGPPLAGLLERLRDMGVAVGYTMGLLAAFETKDAADADLRPQTTRRGLDTSPSAGSGQAPSTSSGQARSADLVEPLSARELEVLGLIAEGLTNAEIASRLFLSLNTVKAHTRNIYGKLGVHSRTQATARARALGVLPFT